MNKFFNRPLAALALAVAIAGCRSSSPEQPNGRPSRKLDPFEQQLVTEFGRQPDSVPARWLGLIGEYGPDTTIRWYALERDRRMYILDQLHNYVPLAETSDTVFDAPRSTAVVSGQVQFHKDATGRGISVRLGDMVLARRNIEPPPGANQKRVTPVRPIEELRREALAATPPTEKGTFKTPDLVEVTRFDSTIKLEVRYATDNNFLGTRLYEQGRAFLQKSAADALVKVQNVLKPFGYGLLIHDAYRPWYVTKIFWDATPDSLHWLVANPAEGSKHNRGAAVDLTLYDRQTGKPVEMPSTYDESSDRAHADYPGGTSLQRWHRALLRRVMEHEGFTVNPNEWWHFDYKDWKSYPIMNVQFDRIPAPAPVTAK